MHVRSDSVVEVSHPHLFEQVISLLRPLDRPSHIILPALRLKAELVALWIHLVVEVFVLLTNLLRIHSLFKRLCQPIGDHRHMPLLHVWLAVVAKTGDVVVERHKLLSLPDVELKTGFWDAFAVLQVLQAADDLIQPLH
jgi:hypothetical protein